MSRFIVRLTIATLVFVAACSDSPSPLRPTLPGTALGKKTDPDTGSGLWRDSTIGTAAGAEYAMYVPHGWNGDVVFYAHGFVAPQYPVALPDVAPLRDGLGALGYAVAYSSYGENGYDYADGFQRTFDLRWYFTSKYGRPKHSYLVGHSLGGQIVEALAERQGEQYDGALAMCGVLGGTRMEAQYIGQLRTVFDFFYPGVLPGNTNAMPLITDPNAEIVGPALAAIQANPNGFGAMAQIDQTRMAGRNSDEMVSTLLHVLALHALEANDLTARAHGHGVFDNSTITYTSATLPGSVLDALNAGVGRFSSPADAQEWLAHNYAPSGDLHIPMITLHKQQDWLVPFGHEAAYMQAVAGAGNSAFLRQRSVNDYGHCEFSGDDTFTNFLDLVKWVTTGVAPAP